MGKINLIHVTFSAILLCAEIINIGVHAGYSRQSLAQPRGRLLTPQEGCGISNVKNSKIVGGTEAKPGAFPWIAIIGHSKMQGGVPTDGLHCSGALITSRHVLTAAHCIKPSLSFVTLGEHNLTTTEDGQHLDVPVIRAVKHPDYNPVDNRRDIAVLTLERDVIFTDRIRPICLPLTQEFQSKSFVGTNPFVAGWGYPEENGVRSEVLMQVQLPVIENKQCQELYSRRDAVFSRYQFSNLVLCAGNLDGGQDTCQGDSGGPLMLPIYDNGSFPMFQIGVVSYGMGCGRPNSPGVYARVSPFIDWIKKQLN